MDRLKAWWKAHWSTLLAVTVTSLLVASQGVQTWGWLHVQHGGTSAPIKFGAPFAEGQRTMAQSNPVAIASDQPPLAVTGTIGGTTPDGGFATEGTQELQATAALQTTGNTSLSSIVTNTTAVVAAPTDIGQNLALSTTAAAAFASAPATKGCYLSSPLANTAAVYCAPALVDAGVTTSTGVELQPGDREFFPVGNANRMTCITGTATQNIHAACL